jgi:zinc and cadmium transporter
MTIFFIIFGTLIAGVGSVLIASLIAWKIMARFSDYLLSFAAGTLLATAFLNLIPESFEISSSSSDLMPWLLGGLLFFFLLDKTQLYHHGHEHGNCPDIEPIMSKDKSSYIDDQISSSKNNTNNSWLILVFGDAVHCFGDGILIASAFMADWTLGVLATFAVLAHEIPHHVGDLVVVSKSLSSKRDALKRVCAAGFFAVLGGVLGFIFLESFIELLPYFLILASSSFIYVSLADLIPQLQKKVSIIETICQMLWLSSGIFFIAVVSHISH